MPHTTAEYLAASDVDLGDQREVYLLLWQEGLIPSQVDEEIGAAVEAAIDRARVIRAAAPCLRQVA